MKTVAIVKYLFLVIGIAMLAGAGLLYSSTRDLLANASSAQGVVIDMVRSQSSDSLTYRPVVVFTATDGHERRFTSSTGTNPPRYASGETVEVLYDPANPQDAVIKGFAELWGGPLILGGLGSVFSLVGGIVTLVGRRRTRRINYLKNHGIPIQTRFQAVELNESLSVNGRHPFVILTQWLNPETSQMHVFRSENIWFDPTDHIPAGDIRVLIAQGNPKRYYVDTSFLPLLAS